MPGAVLALPCVPVAAGLPGAVRPADRGWAACATAGPGRVPHGKSVKARHRIMMMEVLESIASQVREETTGNRHVIPAGCRWQTPSRGRPRPYGGSVRQEDSARSALDPADAPAAVVAAELTGDVSLCPIRNSVPARRRCMFDL